MKIKFSQDLSCGSIITITYALLSANIEWMNLKWTMKKKCVPFSSAKGKSGKANQKSEWKNWKKNLEKNSEWKIHDFIQMDWFK